MKKLIILTGANSHLGKIIARQLVDAGLQVRALVLPDDPAPVLEQLDVEIIRGDIQYKDSLQPLFADTKAYQLQIIQATTYHKLPGLILHPSGIIGPGDTGTNHLIAVIKSYLAGRIRFCPPGGYNLVDVRDVAAATITALSKGRIGESYILSGNHSELADLFAMLRQISGAGPEHCRKIPLWLLQKIAPFSEWQVRRKNQTPLITKYALQTLQSNDNFSHEKATKELDYHPRDIHQTLSDTIAYLDKNQKN